MRTTVLLLCFSATSTHVPPCLSATSLFELDLVSDIDRALSVIDCDDRYYNFMCVCCGYTGRCSSDLLHVLQLWCSMGTRNSCAVQVLNRGRGSLIMFCAWRSPLRSCEDEMFRAVETVKHFSPRIPGSCRCESACALFCMYAACASTMGTWTSGVAH